MACMASHPKSRLLEKKALRSCCINLVAFSTTPLILLRHPHLGHAEVPKRNLMETGRP